MGEFKNLQLSTETIRELSGDEMTQVAGGVRPTIGCDSNFPCGFYVTYLCPSGETWTMNCNLETWAC